MTADELRERLSYDPDTGVFVWLKSAAPYRNGKVAGGASPKGYRSLRIDGKYVLAHRVAWLFVHGEWPDREIDHINGDGTDNRIANLRLATRGQNMMNTGNRRNSTTGFKAVGVIPSGKYRARIRTNGKRIHLGVFPTAEDAAEAYRRAAIELCGEFARFE